MRQEDLQNTLDHMIDGHFCGVTQLEYLKSCFLAPMRSDKSDILTNNDSIDLYSKFEPLDKYENDTTKPKEESNTETQN